MKECRGTSEEGGRTNVRCRGLFGMAIRDAGYLGSRILDLLQPHHASRIGFQVSDFELRISDLIRSKLEAIVGIIHGNISTEEAHFDSRRRFCRRLYRVAP